MATKMRKLEDKAYSEQQEWIKEHFGLESQRSYGGRYFQTEQAATEYLRREV